MSENPRTWGAKDLHKTSNEMKPGLRWREVAAGRPAPHQCHVLCPLASLTGDFHTRRQEPSEQSDAEHGSLQRSRGSSSLRPSSQPQASPRPPPRCQGGHRCEARKLPATPLPA